MRTDQPTITTLEETMLAASTAAVKAFQDAGFYRVHLVVNVVCTSRDPDDDVTTWAAGSRVPGIPGSADRNMLGQSLRVSMEEAVDG